MKRILFIDRLDAAVEALGTYRKETGDTNMRK